INNRGGGSGITGYTWSHNSTNDGYAFQFTAPSAILADAQGLCDFDLMAEMMPVSGLTSAEGIFFGSKKAPFATAEEMIEYCKAHPGEVTIATDSPNGITGALIQEFCNQAGIELKWITSESNEANISLIAGEVDLYIGTWSDAGAYVESGDINALLILSEEKNELFPDVPCCGDLGYTAQLGFYRVFTALEGTPTEAVDAFAAAVVKASQNPEWEKWLSGNGMVNKYVYTAAELDELLKLSHDMGALLADKG
ncbi:MAG: tripartite tricarboxylate transporter substrate-binding protein, partial [Pygmaiobacter sp.]